MLQFDPRCQRPLAPAAFATAAPLVMQPPRLLVCAPLRGLSSAGEHPLCKRRVWGSNPQASTRKNRVSYAVFPFMPNELIAFPVEKPQSDRNIHL